MAQEEKVSWKLIERQQVHIFKPRYRRIKRLFDLLICAVIIPVFLPVGMMIAVAIKLNSPGPVLFEQERVGRGGKVFKIYKFRTMQHNLNDASHRAFMKAFIHGNMISQNGQTKIYKPFTDNQVTRVGRILRKTSLDEMPQLINVIKNEMSLVGPRPNVLWEVEAYREWHKERLEVLPGITGLAQVRGRSGILFDQIVEYDIAYIRKQSVMLDLKILWWTVSSIFFGRGAL